MAAVAAADTAAWNAAELTSGGVGPGFPQNDRGRTRGRSGGAHDVGPGEYMDTNYEFDGTDDDMEEEQDSDEDSATSPASEAR